MSFSFALPAGSEARLSEGQVKLNHRPRNKTAISHKSVLIGPHVPPIKSRRRAFKLGQSSSIKVIR